jgi:hypothetical protein
VIIKVLLSYQKTRPGALLYGTIALAAVIIAYGSQIASAGGNVRDLANAVVRTAQLTGLFLMVSWFVILLCAAVASVCGWLILNAVPGRNAPELREWRGQGPPCCMDDECDAGSPNAGRPSS